MLKTGKVGAIVKVRVTKYHPEFRAQHQLLWLIYTLAMWVSVSFSILTLGFLDINLDEVVDDWLHKLPRYGWLMCVEWVDDES